MEDEVARTDDDHVASHNHASQRHVAILVDDGGDDIRSARTSVAVEHHTQAQTAHRCADQAGHEVLSRSQNLWRYAVRTVHNLLEQPQKECQHKDGISRLDAEFGTQYLDGKSHQYSIDEEVGPLDGEAGGIINDGSDTCGSTCRYLVGDQKSCPCQRIADESEGNHDIVFQLPHQCCFTWFTDMHSLLIYFTTTFTIFFGTTMTFTIDLPSIHLAERSSASTSAWMASEAASAGNSMLKRAFPLKEMV